MARKIAAFEIFWHFFFKIWYNFISLLTGKSGGWIHAINCGGGWKKSSWPWSWGSGRPRKASVSCFLIFFSNLKDQLNEIRLCQFGNTENHKWCNWMSFFSSLHSIAIANLNKSEDFVTNTTAASKYIPRRPRISINWNPPFQTSLHKISKKKFSD